MRARKATIIELLSVLPEDQVFRITSTAGGFLCGALRSERRR